MSADLTEAVVPALHSGMSYKPNSKLVGIHQYQCFQQWVADKMYAGQVMKCLENGNLLRISHC